MTERSALDIILAIPGLWSAPEEIRTSLVQQTDNLMFIGQFLFSKKRNKHFMVDVYGHDPAMLSAFALAGRGLIPQQDLEKIARHTYTLYVIGPAGTLNVALEMMEVTAQLLKAGGIAVKVETAGVAHTAASWQRFASHGPNLLCEAYTAIIQGKGGYISCGMHNLGLSDVQVSDDLSPQEADRLIKIFLTYTLLEKPVLLDGHTFSIDAQSPCYRLTHQEYTLYPPDDPFHNPFGLWHLSRIR